MSLGLAIALEFLIHRACRKFDLVGLRVVNRVCPAEVPRDTCDLMKHRAASALLLMRLHGLACVWSRKKRTAKAVVSNMWILRNMELQIFDTIFLNMFHQGIGNDIHFSFRVPHRAGFVATVERCTLARNAISAASTHYWDFEGDYRPRQGIEKALDSMPGYHNAINSSATEKDFNAWLGNSFVEERFDSCVDCMDLFLLVVMAQYYAQKCNLVYRDGSYIMQPNFLVFSKILETLLGYHGSLSHFQVILHVKAEYVRVCVVSRHELQNDLDAYYDGLEATYHELYP
jgi:hypothetical protein